MDYSDDEKDIKQEEGARRTGNLIDPEREARLKAIRQTFHPSYIPALYVGEEKGPNEVTFHLTNEDHTLCNPLREVLNRHPGVLHVGYTIPHPSEQKVAFVLRVKPGYTCQDVMRDGFQVLMEIFDSLGKKFSDAVIKFKNENNIPIEDDDVTPMFETSSKKME